VTLGTDLRDNGSMSQEFFGDIPLFREIQKLLAAGEGPINFEIARQVADALGTGGTPDRKVDLSVVADFSDVVHSSEVLLASYTRLPFDEPMRIKVMGRSEWIGSTLTNWRWLFEPLAVRFTGELAKLGGEMPEEEGNPLEAVMSQVGPLMLGLQIGTLVGHLAKEVVSRYDLIIPRDSDNALHVIWTNAESLANEYGFDHAEFRRWLALHEVSRQMTMTSAPWVIRYYRSLLLEVVDALEIDTADIERRLMELQSKGIDALEVEIDPQTIPLAKTERHQKALQRLHAFIAVFEGYAAHASAAVASELIKNRSQIDEGMARHKASPSQGKAMLASILGLSFDRSLQSAGETFSAAVLQLKGLEMLNRVWSAPDYLPTMDEIRDPFAWMERVEDDGEQ
jgi:putative hydrolase